MASDLKDVQPSTGSPSPLGGQSSFRFYTRRRRIYTWLLLFVVIVGLPIVTVPPLRDRLSARVQILKIALAGGIEPITLKVGENLEPFPKEYQKPLPQLPHPPQLPPLERIFTASSSHAPQAPSARPQSSPSVAHKVMKITIPQPSPTSPSAAEQPTEQAAAPTSAEPQYRQGKIEQEAYDLLLSQTPPSQEWCRGVIHLFGLSHGTRLKGKRTPTGFG